MATPGSSCNPTPLGHEDNLRNSVRRRFAAIRYKGKKDEIDIPVKFQTADQENFPSGKRLAGFVLFTFTGKKEKEKKVVGKEESIKCQQSSSSSVCLAVVGSLVRSNDTKGRGNLLQVFAGTVPNDNLVALHFKYDQARRRFVEWAQNEIAVVPDFHKRILLSDEAHFWLNGYVNKQNCRIWSEANPQVYVETPLHPEN
ncbi:hypothetical protein TNCV_5078821 [Trichonephila clavipes]|nr:hypothetical protein TNCV_5078821 [Trichonephila clavipes]